MQSSALNPLEPIWPGAVRLCPEWPRPAYRYLRGLHPHPRNAPQEHRFQPPEPAVPLLGPEQWRENRRYRYGIDLYHEGFLWESHEVWEGLWAQCPRATCLARFYRALIFNSAAQIQAHRRNLAGARRHSRRASSALRVVHDALPPAAALRYMGLDLSEVLQQIERHYGPIWETTAAAWVPLAGPPPRLECTDI